MNEETEVIRVLRGEAALVFAVLPLKAQERTYLTASIPA